MKISFKNIIISFLLILLILGFIYNYDFLNKEDELIQYTNIPLKYKDKNTYLKTFDLNTDILYLALNDTKSISYVLDYVGDEKDVNFISKDNKIAQVDSNGLVKGVGLGSTNIIVNFEDKYLSVKVVVTNLINNINTKYSLKKKLLTCNQYSKEDNDLLDEILKSRVEEVGKKTRAGVVAVARFITLEFPYRVEYFSENGRLNKDEVTNYADGEGRYYHEGLYLHSSRYSNLSKSLYGPAPWGCEMYSYVAKSNKRNGLDCSGFISWVFINGGYDPGDIGAGITNKLDFTDIGDKVKLSEALKNNTLKVGDLLSGPNYNGGHIAILIGKNDGNYYVAESLWGTYLYGVIMRTYTAESLKNYFVWQINMNKYYENDGLYTEYWS